MRLETRTDSATGATVTQEGSRVTLTQGGAILLQIDDLNDVTAENTASIILMDLGETRSVRKTISLHQHRTEA